MQKISAKLTGVPNTSKTLSCLSCNKKVSVKSNGKIATCPSCKMMMKTSSCESQWFLKVLFQNTHNINDKLALTLFHPEVHKLAVLVPSNNLDITSEEELILDLLDIESSLCITYDTASNKLMEVSLETI